MCGGGAAGPPAGVVGVALPGTRAALGAMVGPPPPRATPRAGT